MLLWVVIIVMTIIIGEREIGLIGGITLMITVGIEK